MRANALLAPSRTGSPRGPRAHDGTIIPDAVDVMWGTDLTATVTGQGQVAVLVAVDHHSAECVGIHAALRATRFEALEALRQGLRRHFGAFAADIARGLALRHDHGSQSMADDFQKEPRFLGITSSPAFVRAPEGNGCAERFIRTLKENLLWVRSVDGVENLRVAPLELRETCNTTWLIERHGFNRASRTPGAAQRSTAAATTPNSTARLRSRGDRPAAAMPMTTALSPDRMMVSRRGSRHPGPAGRSWPR